MKIIFNWQGTAEARWSARVSILLAILLFSASHALAGSGLGSSLPWSGVPEESCVPPGQDTRNGCPYLGEMTVTERAEFVMGTVARVAIAESDASPATFEAAFAVLRGVDATMSLYRPTSELVRVNSHAARHAEPVGAELFALLERARDLSIITDGAFDVTVLPLLRAWGAYRELSDLGGDPRTVGFAGLQLDPTAHTVSFRRAGMGLDLGAIAKGFALDRARAALLGMGVGRARLDLGGNLALLGCGPDGGWRIAVRDPATPDAALGVLTLEPDSAVATSGNYRRDFQAEGWRAPGHVYDPRTWRPVLGATAVTVWAPDATTADALSTAFLVLGPGGAARVLEREHEAGALFVEAGDGGRRVTLEGRAPRAWRPLSTGRDSPPTAAADPIARDECQGR